MPTTSQDPVLIRDRTTVLTSAILLLVAAAAWVGGEPFLSVMGAIGCVMTAWVGALTLFRG